jgi:hypothetical protein
MPFFGNKRRDFSIQPPRQQVDSTPFFVTDSANIDFTLDNLNLTADLTFTGVTAGTYGDATNIPVLQIDQWGRVTGVTLIPISPSGLALEVNGTPNGDQTLLNLVAGTNMTITDDGLGNITFDATGGGGGIDGANSRRWTSLNTFSAPPPGSARLRTTAGATTDNPSAVIDIRISRYDETNADMQAWFTALNSYRTANPGKAYIQITDSSDNSVFGIYQIGNMAFTSSPIEYWLIGLTYISGSVGLFTSGSTITFSWVLFGADGTGGTGTVTSVSATVPSPTNPAFSVAVPNPTTIPSIDITANGIVSQYIRGDGSLANFPNSTGGGASVNYYLNGSITQGTFGGVTYYQMSKTPILGAGTNFIRTNGAGNGYIASFITDAGDPSFLNIPGGNWNLELYFQSSAAGGSPQFYGEIYKVDLTNVFTLVASGSVNPEGITNGTTIDQYYTSIPVPQTSLLITDRLAIRIYVITSGRTITLHTENGNLCEVLTTFTTGLTALNGLTEQVQNFATPGTSGTAPNWNSVSPNHTLNIPLASTAGVTAGLISKTDYDNFTGKQSALTDTKSVKIVSNNVELDGDLASPGNDKVYGTNTSGTKGWYNAATGGGITALTTDVTASGTGSVVATLDSNYKKGSCGVTFDGQGGTISNGKTAYVQIPYNGTLTSWTLVANASGSCTVTVFKDTFAFFPPTTPTDNIYSVQPTLASQQKNQNLTPTYIGSQATVTAGDYIGFTISGVTTVSWVNLTLSITKTL